MDVKVLELLAVFALATDRAGKICWLSRHNARANGVRPRDVIGKRPRDVWPEARADEVYDATVRRTRRPVEHFAFARTRKGRALWLRVVRSPLPGDKVLTVGVDVTGEVREAAMRSVLRIAVTPGPMHVPPLFEAKLPALAKHAVAGTDERGIAAALELTLDEVRAGLMRLARQAA